MDKSFRKVILPRDDKSIDNFDDKTLDPSFEKPV